MFLLVFSPDPSRIIHTKISPKRACRDRYPVCEIGISQESMRFQSRFTESLIYHEIRSTM